MPESLPLLNLLVDFESPTSGRVYLSGIGSSDDATPLLTPVFWSPQNGGLWPHLNVREHLQVVTDDDSQITALLQAFDLAEMQSAYPDSLSAGERGRVSIARALASGAEVLVFDEPLANVDTQQMEKYWEAIHQFRGTSSLVFSSHSVETVLREADFVVCLNQGKIRFSGDKDTLYRNPSSEDLAQVLGPANWFDRTSDAQHWLGESTEEVQCYRPDQLQVESDTDSPLRITDARYGVSVGELSVLDERTESERTIFHQHQGHRFKVGDYVVLRALLLILLMVFFSGCGDGNQVSTIGSTTVNHWSIPPAGKVIPAPRSVRYGENDEVFVLDNAGRVLVYSTAGKLVRQWEMPAFDVGKPEGICILKDGRIAVTDTHYHRVVFFDVSGTVVGMHGEHGREAGQFIYPVAITQDDQENYYVCEYGDNDRVQKFSADGNYLLEFGSFGTKPEQFQRPSGIVWHDGKIWVADAINNRIQLFSDTGDFKGVLADEGTHPSLYYPYDMVHGQNDDLFVVEYGTGRITNLSKSGKVLGTWGSVGSAKGKLTTPWGLALREDGTILVADTGNRRLVEIQR